jgi:sorbitol-specific phosphotransferase system component IIBC
MAKLLSKNHRTDTAERTQAAYDRSKDAAQDLLARAKKRARFTFKRTRNATENQLAQAQKSTKTRLDKVQNFLAACVALISAIAALFYDKQRKAQEKVKQAQVALLKTATPIVERTQDVVATNAKRASRSVQQAQDAVTASAKRASRSVQQATENAKDATEALQNRYARYQRRRRRNRIIFRIGLLSGVMLALCYTPIAGSDMRQRIVQQWQHYRSYFRR